MNMKQIWEQLCKKNDRLKDSGATVEFSSANLQQLLEQVYEQGKKTGIEYQKLQQTTAQTSPASNPFDPFGSIFGGRK